MNPLTSECYNVMPLTLENHFSQLAQTYPPVENLYSLWILLRKDLAEQTEYSLSTFVHYSIHNASHSLAVIQAIERFLGEERICQLSPTDTFMILCCAYAHDYGMAVTLGHYYRILKSPDFEKFLRAQSTRPLEPEEEEAVHFLLGYLDDDTPTPGCLGDMYVNILTAMEMYLRPNHWKGVRMFWDDFEGLFKNRLKGRFIRGREGIVEICESHGKPFENLLQMSIRADGIVGDHFHPRFIAAMLRLGDLLDLDNGRFPRWFVMELDQSAPKIPKLSILNYQKHQAISHLMITPKKIEISASCDSKHNGYEVACLISEWIEWLVDECENQTKYWSRITQPNFGRPPLVSERIIYLDNHLFTSGQHKLQLIMPQDRVMKLLKGTSIYRDPYVCIRETVQNAVDASLLQLWLDITENRYNSFGVDKYGRYQALWSLSQKEDSSPIQLWELHPDILTHIISNYDINLELILDRSHREYDRDVVLLVVKDRGVGILPDDVRFMTNLGSSKEENCRIAKIIKSMPDWLKPSGIFGIGLQSAFQLTDEIDFYTRVPGEPERRIVFHSYGRSKGRVEIREVDPSQPVVFFDNSLPGTNLRICVDSKKVLAQNPESCGKPNLLYYDSDFSPVDDVDILFEEMRGAVEKTLLNTRLDYFNIFFQTMEINSNNMVQKHNRRRMRASFFCPFRNAFVKSQKLIESESRIIESSLPAFMGAEASGEQDTLQFYQYHGKFACMIDGSTNCLYKMTIRPCRKESRNGNTFLAFPERIHSPYNFQYKFSPLDDSNLFSSDDTTPTFVKMDIQIMDANAAKYVNIDREYLRQSAFSLKELNEIKREIALHWCSYFIDSEKNRNLTVTHKNTKGLAAKKISGEEEKFKPEEYQPRYFRQPEIAVSLALLFYQYVPEKTFREFIAPYEPLFANCSIKLIGESFQIRDLWNRGLCFCCSDTDSPHDPSEYAIPISIKTVQSLPNLMFQVYRIQGFEKSGTQYFLKTCKSASPSEGINMDSTAIYMDYKQALDQNVSKPGIRNLQSIVHKVLMPNNKFRDLIIPRFPKHFSKGENFNTPMADYIDGYILSPFNRDMTQALVKGLRTHSSVESSEGYYQEEREVLVEKVIDIAEHGCHFNRCIQYTLTQRQTYTLTEEEKSRCSEQIIHDEFVRLIKDYCQFLFENRDLVFNKNKQLRNSVSDEDM